MVSKIPVYRTLSVPAGYEGKRFSCRQISWVSVAHYNTTTGQCIPAFITLPVIVYFMAIDLLTTLPVQSAEYSSIRLCGVQCFRTNSTVQQQ